MNLNELKDKLLQLHSKSVLICEWDAHVLRGVVFSRKGKKLHVDAQAEADELNPADSLKKVLAELRSQNWQGNQVLVLTPSAMSAMIELPVSPKKPKPVDQMHELMRWEIEPLLMQHQSQWTLGHLLEYHGLLNENQVKEINEMQKRQSQAVGGVKPDRQSLKRFGELALELGFLTRDQVQSVFVVQDWLRSEYDEVMCGWSPQGEVDDAPGVWNWLVTATYASTYTLWSELCDSFKLNLIGLMPLTGNSLALCERTDKLSVLLETTPLTTTALRLQKQHVTGVHHYLNHSASMLDACLEVYHAENAGQHPAVLLSAPVENQIKLQETLSAALGLEVSAVPSHNPEQLSPGVLAAARHFFQQKGGKRISFIRKGGPLPPVWQRQENQFSALLASILLIIVVTESAMFFQHKAVTEAKTEIDARAKILDDAIARINAQRAEIDKRKAELEMQRQNQRRMEARLAFFGEEMPERALLTQAILGVLQNTINDQIILTRIDEMGRRVGVTPDTAPSTRPGVVVKDNFNIDAWALTESAAQEFVQNMKLAVAAWNMEVRDIQVIEKIGPMNMSGFSVSMSLIHVVAKPEASL
ncbi:MAG: hypothetical protein WEB02_02330 [Methylophaga sp.]